MSLGPFQHQKDWYHIFFMRIDSWSMFFFILLQHGDAYMRLWSLLAEVLVCHLFIAKPIYEPMQMYCQEKP